MVAHLPRRFDLATIEGIVNETDLLLRFRKDAAIQTRSELAVKGARVEATEVKTLFEAVLKRVSELPADIPLYVRPRDGMLAATGVDLDEIVLPFMGRLLRSFTGLGQKWPLAGGQRGYLAATQANFAGKGAEAFPETLKSLARIWGAPPQERTNPLEVAIQAMEALGVPQRRWGNSVARKFLALPGWSALFAHLERLTPNAEARSTTKYELMDFLAVRLTATLAALAGMPRI